MLKRTLIPTLLFSSSVAMAAPMSDEEAPHELIQLRDQLANSSEQAAFEALDTFRPLCDAEGYPLVGNILPKDGADAPPMAPSAPMDDLYQASEFCADVRAIHKDS